MQGHHFTGPGSSYKSNSLRVCNSDGMISLGPALPASQFHWLLQSEYNIFTVTCTSHQIISLGNWDCNEIISQVLAAPTGQIHSGLAI